MTDADPATFTALGLAPALLETIAGHPGHPPDRALLGHDLAHAGAGRRGLNGWR